MVAVVGTTITPYIQFYLTSAVAEKGIGAPIVASQNLQGLLLPIVLVFMVVLVNDRRLMGRHRIGRVANVLAWPAVGLVVILDTVLLGVSALGRFGVHVV